jgi:hypothetical protein
MRVNRAALLALLGLTVGSPLAADPLADRILIANCAERVDAAVSGIEALGTACAGLEAAMGRLGFDALLPADWRTRLSPRALADLAALAERYDGPAPALRPDAASLQAIARALQPPPGPPSWWERIKAWIRHWLESADRNPPAWLRYLPHWRIGGGLAKLVVYGMVTVLLVTVAVIVFVELRAAGVVGKRARRRSAARDVSVETRSKDERALGIEELDAVPPHERPVRLLRLLVEALMRSRRLDHDRDLTCRELIAQARFDDERQRNAFSHIALLAERVLYGPERAPVRITDEMVSGARALHAQLLATAPAAQSAPS